MSIKHNILAQIHTLWERFPDMRFGELLGILVFDRLPDDVYWLDFTASDKAVEKRLLAWKVKIFTNKILFYFGHKQGLQRKTLID